MEAVCNLFAGLMENSFRCLIFIGGIFFIRILLGDAAKRVKAILWIVLGIQAFIPIKIRLPESFSSVMWSITLLEFDTDGTATLHVTWNAINELFAFNQERGGIIIPGLSGFAGIWLCGAILMVLYGAVSRIRLGRVVEVSIRETEKVYSSLKRAENKKLFYVVNTPKKEICSSGGILTYYGEKQERIVIWKQNI